MEESIFTKIIKGEIPCHKVYEDDYSFAFMDIYPAQPGHVVIAAKKQVSNCYDLADEDYQGLMAAVKKVSIKLHEIFPNKKRIAVVIAGLDVDHAHVNLYPIDNGDELHAPQDMEAEPDHEALAEIAKKLAF